MLAGEATQGLRFVGMPPGTALLMPISTKIECQKKRGWQRREVIRRGLPCAAAFACTDYEVQGRTLRRAALDLKGTRITSVNGQATASPCDPYSLYVQPSRCRSLDDIMLVSEVRASDFIGNTVPPTMVAAEERLEQLSRRTIQEVESWGRWE